MRTLSTDFMTALKTGELRPVLDAVLNDNTLDLELRGDSIIVYYRGAKLLTVKENNKSFDYDLLDEKYSRRRNASSVELPQWSSIQEVYDYIISAKKIIDTYDLKDGWEGEIKQMVVKENNYAQNAGDTDFFIIDTEYRCENYQFDLVALHWDSNSSAHSKRKASVAVIEIKQGSNTLKTTNKNPGIKAHINDFKYHVNDKLRKEGFIDEMYGVFQQKYELGLIKGLETHEEKIKNLNLSSDVEFYVILANYKPASSNLRTELESFKENCMFFTGSFMGYGLYSHFIRGKAEILQML